ncbi:hypothetical protein [Salinicoccus kekensis]|uniref:hypothetical protein n=1 Tax=Salinicoccus kekensis TaxID=714307 RepID=UPI001FEA139D|nr:hypothetical protein [Salinicoccus kekensis]
MNGKKGEMTATQAMQQANVKKQRSINWLSKSKAILQTLDIPIILGRSGLYPKSWVKILSYLDLKLSC